MRTARATHLTSAMRMPGQKAAKMPVIIEIYLAELPGELEHCRADVSVVSNYLRYLKRTTEVANQFFH